MARCFFWLADLGTERNAKILTLNIASSANRTPDWILYSVFTRFSYRTVFSGVLAVTWPHTVENFGRSLPRGSRRCRIASSFPCRLLRLVVRSVLQIVFVAFLALPELLALPDGVVVLYEDGSYRQPVLNACMITLSIVALQKFFISSNLRAASAFLHDRPVTASGSTFQRYGHRCGCSGCPQILSFRSCSGSW